MTRIIPCYGLTRCEIHDAPWRRGMAVCQNADPAAVRREARLEADRDRLEAEGERQAELAAERYFESGGSARDAIAADDAVELEREAMDEGLQELRARTNRTESAIRISEQGRGTIPLTETVAKTRYVSVAVTAKMLRDALRRAFPDVRFYVRSKRYSGGASITVWYDGLATEYPDELYRAGMPHKYDVDRVASAFAGSGFDGSIDLRYSIRAWVDADGEVVGHDSTGTAASAGIVAPFDTYQDDGAAEPVRFGADFVFVTPTLPYDVKKVTA